MNRPIKFRAWHIVSKKMFDSAWLFMNEESDDGTASLQTTIENLKQEYELMQFTGLQDKKGVDIYEGDIVSVGKKRVGEVAWHTERGAWILADTDHYNNYLHDHITWTEKIGNIYEHPELLARTSNQ